MPPTTPHPKNTSPFAPFTRFAPLTPLAYIGGIGWVISFFIALFVLDGDSQAGPFGLVVAFLPVPFFILFLVGFLRTTRSLDELHQRIQLEALAFAFPTAVVIVMALGLVQKAGYLTNESFHDNWFLVAMPYFIGLLLARKRYGINS